MSYSTSVQNYEVEETREFHPPYNPTADMNAQYFYEHSRVSLPHSSIVPQSLDAAQYNNNYQSEEYVPSKSIALKNSDVSKLPCYDCNMCSEQFLSKEELQQHKKDIHKNKYTCEDCSKEFTSKLNLILHIDRIHNNMRIKFPCHMCTKEFGSQQYLLTHVTKAHNKKYRCHLCCNEYISENFLMLHVNRDHIKSGGKKYPCPTCLNEYATKKHLKKHMREHEQLFQCSNCSKPFTSKQQILKHIETCLVSQDNQQTDSTPPEKRIRTFNCFRCSQEFFSNTHLLQHVRTCDTQSYIPDFKEIFQCSECFERFTNKLLIQQHIDECHKSASDSKQNSLAEQRPKANDDSVDQNKKETESKGQNKSSTDRNAYECEICYKTFAYMASYKYHIETHNEAGDSERLAEKKLVCPHCSKTFAKPHCLRDHVRTIHEGRQYKCEICSKTFGYVSNYKRHLKAHKKPKVVQTKVKEYIYECSECAQTYSHKRYLTDHIRHIHEGRKYECEICSHTFGHIANYKRHLKSHGEPQAKPTGPRVKRYLECSHCSKTFLQVHCLRDHVRTIHEGKMYECEICFKTFGYSTNYKKHVRSHEDNTYNQIKASAPKKERYLECSHCDRTFRQVHCLRDHIRTKHEGKLYECEVCSKTFGYLDNYRKHLKAHGQISVCLV